MIYSPDAVVDVAVRRGVVTQIVLPDDEVISAPVATGKGSNCADETHTWCVAVQGRDVFVKPKSGAGPNNLIVTTNRRRHVFALYVSESGPSLMRLTIALPPSPVVVAAPSVPAMTAREKVEGRMQIRPMVRNANYSVATGKGSEDLVPVMVFDDGTQTYFSFPNNRPLPTIFQTAADGTEEMVNVRMEGDEFLVADRVARRFVLRLGKSVVAVINEDFDLDGVAPKGGTTVPGVARVIKSSATGRQP